MTGPGQPSLNRRDLLRLGAASTMAGALGHSQAAGAPPEPQPPPPVEARPLHTRLCDLFGIRYPIFQAPMARVVTPEMVAAVAGAGGLGFLPGAGLPPEDLRQQIRRVRQLTDRPFGVNLILHPALTQPLTPDRVPAETLRAVQTTLNVFRTRLGLPPGPERAPALPAIVDAAFDVVLEERVPVFSVGVGRPTGEMVNRCRAQGTKVVVMVTTVPDALEMAALGADALIAQGGEAGGHRSTWIKRASAEQAAIGTLSLVPQVVDATTVPVIAAGGITDGRQLVAALALGASGVLMGTRFVATRESAAPAFYKQALVDRDSDATTITDAFTGLYARVVRSTYTEEYRASGAPVLPVLQQPLAGDITAASEKRGSGEYYPMYAGQGVGMIRDVPAAADVVAGMVDEARRALASLAARASPA